MCPNPAAYKLLFSSFTRLQRGGMKEFCFSQRPLAALAAASAVGICAPAAPLLRDCMSCSRARCWVYWRSEHCKMLGEGEK